MLLSKNKIKRKELEINLIYDNNNRVIKYTDIINYLKHNNSS